MSPLARRPFLRAGPAGVALAALAGDAPARQIEIVGRLHLRAVPGTADLFTRFLDVDGDGGRDFAWGGDDTSQAFLGVHAERGGGAYQSLVALSWTNFVVPDGLAAGDFDGDGVRELVYTAQLPFAQVLRRDPFGQYEDAFTFPIPAGVTSGLDTGDLDGDGDVDVARVSHGSLHVHWNVGGAFPGPATVVALAPDARRLALGDVDGDGDLDALAVKSAGGGAVTLVSNLGGGVFAPHVDFPVGATPSDLRLADFDGDARLDVVTANTSPAGVSVLLGTGGPAFAPPVTSPAPFPLHALDVGDADGDGDPDLAVSGRTSVLGGVAVFLHQSAGAFGPAATCVATPVRDAAFTDLDGDGDLDLAIVDRDALLNRGDGSFVERFAQPAAPGSPTTHVLSGDQDLDGDEDLVLWSPFAVSIAIHAADGTLLDPQVVASGSSFLGVQFEDADGDLDPDLVTRSVQGGVRVQPNLITSFGPAIPIPGGTNAGPLQLGDVDGDGRRDLVTRIGDALLVALHAGGTAWSAFTPIAGVTAGPGGWALGDVDGDGDPDLVTSAANGLHLHANQGGLAFAPPLSLAPSAGILQILALDLDADGDLDLVTSGGFDATSVRWNLGGGAYAPALVLGPPTAGLQAEDLDHDGDLDLLGAIPGTRGDVFERTGPASFAPVRHFGLANAPSIATIDLDHDGDEDVVASSFARTFVAENGGRTGVALCAGDGSGAPCPCGNASAPGAGLGCLNSIGRAGSLRAAGSTALATDTLCLAGAGMTESLVLYIQGTSAVANGAGTVFGDGLRCVAGSVVRLGVRANVAGASTFPGPGDPPLRVLGQVGAPGTRLYQAWYRDAAGFCTSATWNLTNALRIAWGA